MQVAIDKIVAVNLIAHVFVMKMNRFAMNTFNVKRHHGLVRYIFVRYLISRLRSILLQGYSVAIFVHLNVDPLA